MAKIAFSQVENRNKREEASVACQGFPTTITTATHSTLGRIRMAGLEQPNELGVTAAGAAETPGVGASPTQQTSASDGSDVSSITSTSASTAPSSMAEKLGTAEQAPAEASESSQESTPAPVVSHMTGAGAMAQLGLVPPNAAMSIIKNQQSPSALAANKLAGINANGLQAVGSAGPTAGGMMSDGGEATSDAGQIGAQGMQAANANGSVAAPSAIGSGFAGENSAASNETSASGALPHGLIYPALHLHPVNDTFAPKQISLAPPGPHNRIRIGRQTNAKTVPHPSNGYFDSKVLSRMHAEVWSQDGKVRSVSLSHNAPCSLIIPPFLFQNRFT